MFTFNIDFAPKEFLAVQICKESSITSCINQRNKVKKKENKNITNLFSKYYTNILLYSTVMYSGGMGRG